MKKYDILLVDDDILILKTLSQALKNKGYNVTVKNSGEEALQILEEKNFNLIITDLVMELVDGLEVLKKAKEIAPETVVIILTGYGDINTAIEALRSSADDYLLKPCKLDEIYFKVSSLLEKQELKKKIKLYEKILPVCCICKKIRDDSGKEPGKGEWMSTDKYIYQKTGVLPSHTYCPECNEAVMVDAKKKLSNISMET